MAETWDKMPSRDNVSSPQDVNYDNLSRDPRGLAEPGRKHLTVDLGVDIAHPRMGVSPVIILRAVSPAAESEQQPWLKGGTVGWRLKRASYQWKKNLCARPGNQVSQGAWAGVILSTQMSNVLFNDWPPRGRRKLRIPITSSRPLCLITLAMSDSDSPREHEVLQG